MTVFHQSTRKTITGHAPLRSALRDTQTYSSDLQGDADVRDYRQLPLEVDPPLHHLYRSALAPYFVKPAIEKHAESFRKNSESLLKIYFAAEPKEVVSDLALPLVMHNLGVIYNRPQDVEEWISWGPDVWTAESEKRDGAVLHRYLDSVYEEAVRHETRDIYGEIANLEIAGKRISPLEFRGIVGVLLAGGRDTVVKLLTGIMWHFARTDELMQIRSKEITINSAIQEFLRFLTPLPLMNRTTTPETGASDLPEDRYVGMSFISGNFDQTVFEEPFTLNLNRARNPHLSFGFGPHTCLGNHIAEIEARVFMETLSDSNLNWKIHTEEINFHSTPFEKVPDQFKSLKVVLR
ncbi:MAG: cytochrome P450 [Candidatus Nanopelagicaceae bacterium]|nr:cytochrome P450 [Candidatus Nanopelagicaceae bacterium]